MMEQPLRPSAGCSSAAALAGNPAPPQDPQRRRSNAGSSLDGTPSPMAGGSVWTNALEPRGPLALRAAHQAMDQTDLGLPVRAEDHQRMAWTSSTPSFLPTSTSSLASRNAVAGVPVTSSSSPPAQLQQELERIPQNSPHAMRLRMQSSLCARRVECCAEGRNALDPMVQASPPRVRQRLRNTSCSPLRSSIEWLRGHLPQPPPQQLEDLSDGEVEQLSFSLEQEDDDEELDQQDADDDVDEDEEYDDEEEEDEETKTLAIGVSMQNRDINICKARALEDSLIKSLVRLGFQPQLTLAALDAGVQEICHYDADCELAYVDIFMSLVRMVCDAHLKYLSEGDLMGNYCLDSPWQQQKQRFRQQQWQQQPQSSLLRPQTQELFTGHAGVMRTLGPIPMASSSMLPNLVPSSSPFDSLPLTRFKWPVFDMAQFEFGSARQGTCFENVCVLINLPKVALERIDELNDILSCHLFVMLGNPIQVVLPSCNSTARSKGHAFIEFENAVAARLCAKSIDGLLWGRGPFARIRAQLFRDYQVNSSHEDSSVAQSLQETTQTVGSSQTAWPSESDEDSEEEDDDEEDLDKETASFHSSSDEEDHVDNNHQYPVSTNHAPHELQQVVNDRHGDASQQCETRQQGVEQVRDIELMNSTENDHDEGEEGKETVSASLARDCPNSSLHRNMPSEVNTPAATKPRIEYEHCASPATHRVDNQRTSEQSEVFPISAEMPWKTYCEELLACNRELHEQLATVRRRFAQVDHRSQKLQLLLDRIERDRDGLLFENDVLQTQMSGFMEIEHHRDALLKETVALHKRLKRKDRQCAVHLDALEQFRKQHVNCNQTVQCETQAEKAQREEQMLVQAMERLGNEEFFANKSLDEMQGWEDKMETCSRLLRRVKEQKAAEQKEKLDREMEKQQELKLCVVCLENEKTMLCLPCRHLCLCESCSRREEVQRCPMCRLDIDEMLLVYA